MSPTPIEDIAVCCLRAFTQLVPASRAVFYHVDQTLQARDFTLLGMSTAMHGDYLQHYHQFDPLQPRHCASEKHPVVPLTLAMARQPLRNNRRYEAFLQQHGVIDVVEIFAHRAGQPTAAISLLRDAESGRFTPDQLARLDALQTLLQMAVAHTPPCVDRLSELTPRERQLALLVRDGASNKELAQTLNVGLPTIKTHLINLFRKTGVTRRTELVNRLFL